jgi:hypothetical protein
VVVQPAAAQPHDTAAHVEPSQSPPPPPPPSVSPACAIFSAVLSCCSTATAAAPEPVRHRPPSSRTIATRLLTRPLPPQPPPPPPPPHQRATFTPLSRQDFLRPEAAETLFYLWRATGDEIYREWGWNMFRAWERWCKCPTGGYATVRDVYPVGGRAALLFALCPRAAVGRAERGSCGRLKRGGLWWVEKMPAEARWTMCMGGAWRIGGGSEGVFSLPEKRGGGTSCCPFSDVCGGDVPGSCWSPHNRVL